MVKFFLFGNLVGEIIMNYTIFKTGLGWVGVVGGEKGIKKIILPYPQPLMVERVIAQEFPEAKEGGCQLITVVKFLSNYFEGNNHPQEFLLDWSGYSDFLVQVWRITQSIPWGEVRSYKWIGNQLKRPHSFRAVGMALKKNPFPIIVPCHRVIRSDGSLGGFSGYRGSRLKQKLLEIEGIRFDEERKLNW